MFIIITKDKKYLGEGYIKNPPLHSDRDFYHLDIGSTNEIHFYEKEDDNIEYERYMEYKGEQIKLVLLYENLTTDPVTSSYTISKDGIRRIIELSENK